MDILELVKKNDPQNQFEVLINTYQQIEFAWNNSFDLTCLKNKKFDNIIISGLGGSAISADLMLNFAKDDLTIPLFVNRNYSLPKFANKNTLVIASSYSGNTEETISVFKQAIEKGLSVVAVTTGGKIEELAAANKVPLVKLQKGFQPRYSLGISFFSLLKVLQTLSLIPSQDIVVKGVIDLWKTLGEEFKQTDNYAFRVAQQVGSKIPVIYSYADFNNAIGYRLKCQFNENSKLHAFSNVIHEMNHNEIIGWETFTPNNFDAILINIEDTDYPEQIKKRFTISTELCKKNYIESINLKSELSSLKLRIMELIYLGDWISYYAAILRNFDPSEIDNIYYLKDQLA